MVERFFFTPDRKFEVLDHGKPSAVLSGPPYSGKTSLLFEFAFNSAAAGNAVVILCNRRRGIDPSSEIFRRIQVKCVDDDEGIKNYFAAFHLHPTFPASIIVDDFGHFFDERNCQERHNSPRGRDLAMVRVLALCQSAISHANVAVRAAAVKSCCPTLFIYRRWASGIYTIKGDGSRSLVVKKSDSDSGLVNADDEYKFLNLIYDQTNLSLLIMVTALGIVG